MSISKTTFTLVPLYLWQSFKAFKLILLALSVVISPAVYASDIRVSAAASLTDAITELVNLYVSSHPQTTIKTSFAGSSTLAKQIENGAPADIFISADKDWVDYLEKRGLLKRESRKDLLSNDVVIISPVNRNYTIPLEKNSDITAHFQGKLCTGEPAYVPVGKYAKQALEYYGWWTAIAPRLVGTEDVRTALAFVERGECALGIVYKTDALMSKKVSIVASFPAESHLPIVYPGALTQKAKRDAVTFWQFLQSSAAAEVFLRYGFTLPNN